MIAGITGSTVVVFELADFLIKQGAKVLIYTCFYGHPMRKFFEDKKIKVVCFDEEPELHFTDFDYVWVNSQIMPRSMIKDLKNKQTMRTIFVICQHLILSRMKDHGLSILKKKFVVLGCLYRKKQKRKMKFL